MWTRGTATDAEGNGKTFIPLRFPLVSAEDAFCLPAHLSTGRTLWLWKDEETLVTSD